MLNATTVAILPAIYDYAAGNPVLAQDTSGRFLLLTGAAALLVGGYIFNEIRKVAQSDDVKKVRRSYERITDVADDEDALAEAEKAHSRLDKASRRAGRTAVDCTIKGVTAVTSPASNLSDVAEAAKDLAESLMDSDDGGYYDDD